MAGYEKLISAVVTKLQADTGAGSLVTLTGHTSAESHIARSKPLVEKRSPFIGVSAYGTPFMGPDVTTVKRSVVIFEICANGSGAELTVLRICDRLEYLLDGPSPATNRSYYDFSDASINTKQVRLKSRGNTYFDEELDVWAAVVDANVIWIGEPCP